MDCPFCGNKLISGRIKSARVIDFVYPSGPSPYQEHTPLQKTVTLGNFWTGVDKDCYACEVCNKIIMECKFGEKNNKANI